VQCLVEESDARVVGPCVKSIGWEGVGFSLFVPSRKTVTLIDLKTRTFKLSERNRFKTLYGLMRTDMEGHMTVREMERLVSWASRHSMVFPLLRLVSAALYRDIAGRV
jgi:hypothetical protein